MKLEDYAEQVLQETLAAAEVDAVPRLEAFTQLVMERLAAAGEFDEGEVAYHRKTGVEVSGWAHDPDRAVLHLCVTDWSGITPSRSLTATLMGQPVKRLIAFVEKCGKDYAGRLEESDDVWEVADFIAREAGSLSEIRLYLLSDGVARRAGVPEIPSSILGVPATLQLWDLERLFRLDTSGLEREPITVRVSEFQEEALPVLEGPNGGDHRVYLVIFPARFLADLYATYGSRLLERNVRSFLQARGAVNKGIRETILDRPSRFLAYNNGVSATAGDVTLTELEDGGSAIVEIHDLQIVNGGQTTASLHHAATRDKADLTGVAVQAKLTVVQHDLVDELVPYISKYSNTQNKVTGADFSANHPFHVKVEELSRTVWAPAPDGSQKQTRWFFERARGQYADEIARAGTTARQRQFKATCPTTQKFTKTDLAKYVHTWGQLPHVVALGAEKSFREFMLRLEEVRVDPDVEWFQRFVATAILFRTAEKAVQAQGFGGYRAQVVTYTLAKLSNATQQRVDLADIWRRQRVSDATLAGVIELSHSVHDVIISPSGRVRHIGEWAKKLDCWKAVQEILWTVPSVLETELISLGRRPASAHATSLGGELSPQEASLVAEIDSVPAEAWFAVSHWAKETGNLQGWQRSIAFSVGRLRVAEKSPSVKQAAQAKKLYEEGLRLGFRP